MNDGVLKIWVATARHGLPPAQRTDLNRRLRGLAPSLRVCDARWFYVCAASALDAVQLAGLEQALDARFGHVSPVPDAVWIGPRRGVWSAFSSQVTGLLQSLAYPVTRVERVLRWRIEGWRAASLALRQAILAELHDPLLQERIEGPNCVGAGPGSSARVRRAGRSSWAAAFQQSLDAATLAHLKRHARGRALTDAEWMVFAQLNSEHCRHHTFHASWCIDGRPQSDSLLDMIRHTHALHPQHTLSAHHDHAAVIEGGWGQRLFPDPRDGIWRAHAEPIDFAIKVETHNHPTALSPWAGAATGAGGEIRDLAAVGRGAQPKAALVGWSVSHLRIPGRPQPWERARPLPPHLAGALRILCEAPLGAAAFNNEFGRPLLLGYLRSYEHVAPALTYAYDKPVMLAGGISRVRRAHVHKAVPQAGEPVWVIGGPALCVGLGGGLASSQTLHGARAPANLASVQRADPEMQRRAQQVLDACWAMNGDNPIRTVHDVGAGGIANAVAELAHAAGLGCRIDLRCIPCADPGMDAAQILCNESQERYVLVVAPDRQDAFRALCAREQCPGAPIGHLLAEPRFCVEDGQTRPVDCAMAMLFDVPRAVHAHDLLPAPAHAPPDLGAIRFKEAVQRVLRHPSVACKDYLVTIADRSVGGLSARDAMVGPWQVPVADCGVSLSDFSGWAGEAMALGERAPLAPLNPVAAARMALGEALTNLAAAPVADLGTVRLSANWMAAAQQPGQQAALFQAVRALATELCPALRLSIPVGKDSLAMQVCWQEGKRSHRTQAPLTAIITAFAHVADARETWTPRLRLDCGPTELLFIDLADGQRRLGGSMLAQVFDCALGPPPDLDAPGLLPRLFAALHALRRAGHVLAYHDRSDGGLLVSLLEMAFAGHCGLSIRVPARCESEALAYLFNEELGAVLQVRVRDREAVSALLAAHGLDRCTVRIGQPQADPEVCIETAQGAVLRAAHTELARLWCETSRAVRALRDRPKAAAQSLAHLQQATHPGWEPRVDFDWSADATAPYLNMGKRPRVAVWRAQGSNGQAEMAAAFMAAGFEAVDVHSSDLLEGRQGLARFDGLAACGGFSHGDHLGAGRAWALSVRHHPRFKDELAAYLADRRRFVLGVCNGCQLLTHLKDLIPGADHWPDWVGNASGQYESRQVLVEVLPTDSVFLRGMEGACLPVVVAHAQGRARWRAGASSARAGLCLRYVDHRYAATEAYPDNPSGSATGAAGFTGGDGRILALMPHPERVFRSVQLSYCPDGWPDDSPWMRLFRNARAWLH